MKKNVLFDNLGNKYFTLTNKYFYWSIFIVLITILTGINNYGFYTNVEKNSIKAVRQFEKTILSVIGNYPNSNGEELQNIIIEITEQWNIFAYNNNGIKLILLNGVEKEIRKTRNWNDRTASKIIIDINKLINKDKGGIEVFSNFAIFNSIINSITFSIKDIYADIFYKNTAPFDGKVFIKDKEQNQDEIIIVHEESKPSIKEEYIVIEGFNGESKEIYLKPYSKIYIENDKNIKKGDILATNSIHTIIYNIENTYFERSKITIFFAIFTYLMLWFSRKRTYKLAELQEKEDQRLKEEFEQDILMIDLDKRNELSYQVKKKLIQYNSIINPPINHLNIEDIFEKELDTIGTKFRKVTEKIIFEVYRNKIGELPYRINLSQAVEELHRKQFLSDTAKNYLNIVRIYGNISSHYSSNSEITKEEAISIASALMYVVEEIYEKNLLNKNI